MKWNLLETFAKGAGLRIKLYHARNVWATDITIADLAGQKEVKFTGNYGPCLIAE